MEVPANSVLKKPEVSKMPGSPDDVMTGTITSNKPVRRTLHCLSRPTLTPAAQSVSKACDALKKGLRGQSPPHDPPDLAAGVTSPSFKPSPWPTHLDSLPRTGRSQAKSCMAPCSHGLPPNTLNFAGPGALNRHRTRGHTIGRQDWLVTNHDRPLDSRIPSPHIPQAYVRTHC